MEHTFIVKVDSPDQVTVDDMIMILGKGIADKQSKNKPAIHGITVRQGVSL
jgi:hypothetical protein